MPNRKHPANRLGSRREWRRSVGRAGWELLGTALDVGADLAVHSPMRAAEDALSPPKGTKR
ncbi:MAG: hypothetical protein AAF360_14920 [Pseudomonadota bacterium]